ncbi:unnamed protein product [Amoebophrya sp. A120]|nr:unnamed protein product [Amoebophrya sp. A120]|eukprot:GSA120T00016187001.1
MTDAVRPRRTGQQRTTTSRTTGNTTSGRDSDSSSRRRGDAARSRSRRGGQQVVQSSTPTFSQRPPQVLMSKRMLPPEDHNTNKDVHLEELTYAPEDATPVYNYTGGGPGDSKTTIGSAQTNTVSSLPSGRGRTTILAKTSSKQLVAQPALRTGTHEMLQSMTSSSRTSSTSTTTTGHLYQYDLQLVTARPPTSSSRTLYRIDDYLNKKQEKQLEEKLKWWYDSKRWSVFYTRRESALRFLLLLSVFYFALLGYLLLTTKWATGLVISDSPAVTRPFKSLEIRSSLFYVDTNLQCSAGGSSSSVRWNYKNPAASTIGRTGRAGTTGAAPARNSDELLQEEQKAMLEDNYDYNNAEVMLEGQMNERYYRVLCNWFQYIHGRANFRDFISWACSSLPAQRDAAISNLFLDKNLLCDVATKHASLHQFFSAIVTPFLLIPMLGFTVIWGIWLFQPANTVFGDVAMLCFLLPVFVVPGMFAVRTMVIQDLSVELSPLLDIPREILRRPDIDLDYLQYLITNPSEMPTHVEAQMELISRTSEDFYLTQEWYDSFSLWRWLGFVPFAVVLFTSLLYWSVVVLYVFVSPESMLVPSWVERSARRIRWHVLGGHSNHRYAGLASATPLFVKENPEFLADVGEEEEFYWEEGENEDSRRGQVKHNLAISDAGTRPQQRDFKQLPDHKQSEEDHGGADVLSDEYATSSPTVREQVDERVVATSSSSAEDAIIAKSRNRSRSDKKQGRHQKHRVSSSRTSGSAEVREVKSSSSIKVAAASKAAHREDDDVKNNARTVSKESTTVEEEEDLFSSGDPQRLKVPVSNDAGFSSRTQKDVLRSTTSPGGRGVHSSSSSRRKVTQEEEEVLEAVTSAVVVSGEHAPATDRTTTENGYGEILPTSTADSSSGVAKSADEKNDSISTSTASTLFSAQQHQKRSESNVTTTSSSSTALLHEDFEQFISRGRTSSKTEMLNMNTSGQMTFFDANRVDSELGRDVLLPEGGALGSRTLVGGVGSSESKTGGAAVPVVSKTFLSSADNTKSTSSPTNFSSSSNSTNSRPISKKSNKTNPFSSPDDDGSSFLKRPNG